MTELSTREVTEWRAIAERPVACVLCTTVVPVEETTPLDAQGGAGRRGRQVLGPVPAATLVHARVGAGNAIRSLGSDVRAGDVIARPGDLVTPAVVALASGAGVAAVAVRRRPIVAVLATGDEVRAPGTDLGPAGIPDANGPGLRALVRDAGAVPLDLGIAVDTLEDVEARLRVQLHALEVGRAADVGGIRVPLEEVAGRDVEVAPGVVAGEDVGVLLREHLRAD